MYALDCDTFLVGLYTITDDLYRSNFPQNTPKPGTTPLLADSEIITLALCAQWVKWSERQLIHYVKTYWHHYFPKVVCQPEYHKRFQKLAPRIVTLVPQVAQAMQAYCLQPDPTALAVAYTPHVVLDCVPVPLMKRCRGEKAKLFSPQVANIGKGGSDKEWYYGVRLGLVVAPEGLITGFILAPARTSERWPAEYLFYYRHGGQGQLAQATDLKNRGKKRVGPGGSIWPRGAVGNPHPGIYLTDRGFSGSWWQDHWQQEHQALVLNPLNYRGPEETALKHLHASCRQVIETVNDHLSFDLGLNRLGARSVPGLMARVAAKLLAFNLGIWLNKIFHRPTFALATLFSL